MKKLKLRPWEFEKDEKMRLYWLCSPFRDETGRWTIKAVFVPNACKTFNPTATGLLFDKTVKSDYYVSEFPWGVLPNLRVGKIYTDGLIEDDFPKVTIGSIFVPNIQNGRICKAFDIPVELYDFFKDKQMGQEKIWRFQVEDKIYFLPCLEIIRAFFATSKTFTNQLLKPHGLDSLIIEENCNEGQLTITLSHEIPKAIVKDEQVTHLLWVYYNETARSSWQSIYNNLFSKAIKISPDNPVKMLSEGLPLELKPPLVGSCHLNFTGTTLDKYCLIHELLSIEGFPEIEFEKINYSHASFRGQGKNNKTGEGKGGFPVKGKGCFVQDSPRRRVKTETNQSVVEAISTVFGFSKLPNIERYSLSPSKIPLEQENEVDKVAHPLGTSSITNEDELVGTDESYLGGEVRPVEFGGLQLRESEDYTGLNDFLKTLDYIAKLNPQLSINRNIYNIPGSSLFCFREQNIKRNFAVAYVSKKSIQPVYIFEVARHDEWRVSTLLLQFHPKIEKKDKISKILLSTLEDMVKNNGHWQVETLEQSSDLKFIRIKHYKESSFESRALRFVEKLWILGLH